MSEHDPVLARVGEALERVGRGDRAGARALLNATWEAVGEGGPALHRCAVAHTLADLHDDPAEELEWDLRAFTAGLALTDEEMAAAGVAGPALGFLPSLHLNVADAYRRLGEVALARDHAVRGLAALGAEPDDGYRAMVRGGLERVARAVGAG